MSLLTKLFNLSLNYCKIPIIWTTSKIIPLLKPGKTAVEAKSWRPVSLLCSSIKILEKLILPIVQEPCGSPSYQHGFKKRFSTVTVLNRLNHDIPNGFNEKKPALRTAMLQLDLSKTFDMLKHETLIQDRIDSSLDRGIEDLHGRQSYVNFRNVESKFVIVRFGEPQGGVLSPNLFCFYKSNLPEPPSGCNLKLLMYADDITIYG